LRFADAGAVIDERHLFGAAFGQRRQGPVRVDHHLFGRGERDNVLTVLKRLDREAARLQLRNPRLKAHATSVEDIAAKLLAQRKIDLTRIRAQAVSAEIGKGRARRFFISAVAAAKPMYRCA
jgi:hypothetical protein